MLLHKLHNHRQDLLQLLAQHYMPGCNVIMQIVELRAQITQDKAELRTNDVAVADYLIDEHDSSRWAAMAAHTEPAEAPAQLAMLRGLREGVQRRLSLRMVLAIRAGMGSGQEILSEIKDLKHMLAAFDTIISALEASSGTALALQHAVGQRQVAGDQPRATHVDTTILRQQNLLATNRNNLNHWMRQVQAYGGLEYAPVATRNNIRAAHLTIAALEARLCQAAG
jgi:hypothetical protein